MSREVLVTVHYLEMKDPRDLRPPSRPAKLPLEVRRAEVPSPELNRFLYTAVGGDWYWIDRLGWTYDDWLRYLELPGLETWVGYAGGNPAGYFELETGRDAQIRLFGLLPGFIGKGLGGVLLTRAVERAWEAGARRVWLHTCSLDHPAALANYEARGFRRYRSETFTKRLPAKPPGPWPGAR